MFQRLFTAMALPVKTPLAVSTLSLILIPIPLAGQIISVRTLTVQFREGALGQLSKMPLLIEEGGTLTGTIESSGVAIQFDRIKTMEVSGSDRSTWSVTTNTGESFNGVSVPDTSVLSAYGELDSGFAQLKLPLSSISKMELGARKTINPWNSGAGSIRGAFRWKDTPGLELTVWNGPQDNTGALGHFGFNVRIAKAEVAIPWGSIRSIEIVDDKSGSLRTTLASGDVLNGNAGETSIKVWWKGIEAEVAHFVSAEFAKDLSQTEPERTYSCCDGAGGCGGGGFSGDWGRWRFTGGNGETVEGGLDGGYSGSEFVGNYPDGLTLGKYDDGRISFDLMPRSVVTSAIFDWKSDSVQVHAVLRNGENVETAIRGAGFQRLQQEGYVLWSGLGGHQIRTLVRVRKLTRMDLTELKDREGWESQVSEIKHNDYAWQLDLGNGINEKVRNLEGYQSQNVPKSPGAGYYWRIRPPVETGLAGGGYVVSPHASGFHIIPLYLVKTINPKTHMIELRSDASGKILPYTRFHPGRYWIAEGNSGMTYVDEDADAPIGKGHAEMLKFETEKGNFAIAANRVETIQQIDQPAIVPEEKRAEHKPVKRRATIENSDGSKIVLDAPELDFDAPSRYSSPDPYSDDEPAIRLLLMGKMSSSYRSSSAFACNTGSGLWRKFRLEEVRRFFTDVGKFYAALPGSEKCELGKTGGDLHGETSLGQVTVLLQNMKVVEFSDSEAGDATPLP